MAYHLQRARASCRGLSHGTSSKGSSSRNLTGVASIGACIPFAILSRVWIIMVLVSLRNSVGSGDTVLEQSPFTRCEPRVPQETSTWRKSQSMMRILVTGAGGNFNRILVPMLLEAGHDVVAMDTAALAYACECVRASVLDDLSLLR